ncbi:MAG: hypothetical protein M0R46_02220 [Candidatus Muirbacterium halophilum]|nr:hypothetical protein [Candidatus Muirbacterium halophilum]
MLVQNRIRLVLVSSLLLINVFFISGCFSGASPGMKVLNITAEQYFNDSLRYLNQSQFLYDQSKINTALNNLEKNSGSGDSSSREKIDIMINYLKILKQYSGIFKNNRRPDRKELDKIYKEIHKNNSDNYLFLRLFYYYVKSYDRKPLTRIELLNVYNLHKYLNSKDFRFIFKFGGELIDEELISYMKDSVFLQHKYFNFVKENLNISLDENKLNPDVLLRAGEFYFRALIYSEAMKYIKYFRLPTFSEYGLKDHCLNILEKIYEIEKMETDKKVVTDKIKNKFSSNFHKMFSYISPEEKVLYNNLFNNADIDVIEDMLDISEKDNKFFIKDFESFQQKELIELYRVLTEDKKNSISIDNKIRDFYTLLNDNEFFNKNTCFTYFYNDNIVILSTEKKQGFFVKMDNISLKKREENSFIFRNPKKEKDEEIVFVIEFSSEKGIQEEKIFLNSGDFE